MDGYNMQASIYQWDKVTKDVSAAKQETRNIGLPKLSRHMTRAHMRHHKRKQHIDRDLGSSHKANISRSPQLSADQQCWLRFE